jgi:hypothetical protein
VDPDKLKKLQEEKPPWTTSAKNVVKVPVCIPQCCQQDDDAWEKKNLDHLVHHLDLIIFQAAG